MEQLGLIVQHRPFKLFIGNLEPMSKHYLASRRVLHKHAIMCQYRAGTGPMLAASAQYRHVYRDGKVIWCVRLICVIFSLWSVKKVYSEQKNPYQSVYFVI